MSKSGVPFSCLNLLELHKHSLIPNEILDSDPVGSNYIIEIDFGETWFSTKRTIVTRTTTFHSTSISLRTHLTIENITKHDILLFESSIYTTLNELYRKMKKID